MIHLIQAGQVVQAMQTKEGIVLVTQPPSDVPEKAPIDLPSEPEPAAESEKTPTVEEPAAEEPAPVEQSEVGGAEICRCDR